MLPGTGCCHYCGQPGHWERDCKLTIPAATKAEHLGRIALFTRLWVADEIDPATEKRIGQHEKRKLIEAENAMWNPKAKEKAK